MSRSATTRANEESDAAARVAKLAALHSAARHPRRIHRADGRRARIGWFLDKLMEFPRRYEPPLRQGGPHIRDTASLSRLWGYQRACLAALACAAAHRSREWREIAQGIEQRARLLELVLADIYGEGRLIAAGDLPAPPSPAVRVSAPLHGVKPPGGNSCIFTPRYRARSGWRWWVLGDRSQALRALATHSPTGCPGTAFPALYRDMNVERLAPFFEAFRFGLTSMAQRSNPRICLLTPGPFNETYFEQAYLARYLGLLLVEGGDLTMRDGKVHVRTIAGLKRADVIWRRIDSDFADPLELNAKSRLGVPGLVDALREVASSSPMRLALACSKRPP